MYNYVQCTKVYFTELSKISITLQSNNLKSKIVHDCLSHLPMLKLGRIVITQYNDININNSK